MKQEPDLKVSALGRTILGILVDGPLSVPSTTDAVEAELGEEQSEGGVHAVLCRLKDACYVEEIKTQRKVKYRITSIGLDYYRDVVPRAGSVADIRLGESFLCGK
jgi:DNA-binding PadR family transcriptional regulator